MEVFVDMQRKAKLAALHERALKAAQRMTAATPGTLTKTKRENAYDSAQAAFYKALGIQQ